MLVAFAFLADWAILLSGLANTAANNTRLVSDVIVGAVFRVLIFPILGAF